MTSVLLTASKSLNTDMHLVIYKPIWFKLDLMVDVTERYALNLVYVTSPLIQDHMGARKQKIIH